MHEETLTTFKRETVRRVGGAMFVFACLLAAGYPKPLSAATTTIAGVTATVNGVVRSPAWTSQALAPGQTLVLTANAPTSNTYAGYNFDISDVTCSGGCPAAVISFTADGTPYTLTDTKQALTLKNTDTGGVKHNEAQDYTVIGSITTGSGLVVTVSVAYADSLHSDACGSDVPAGLPGSGTCFPSIFNGAYGTTPATFFQGSAQEVPPGYGGGPYHDGCGPASANCFDGGVIMFAVSQPALQGCSVTQGGWHAPPHGNNPGMLLTKNFSTVYPGGTVTIGNAGGNFHLTFDSAADVQAFLPAGSTPGVLTATAIDPTSSSAGVFAGQVLALELNVDFSTAGVTPAGLGGFVLKNTGTSLDGKTVSQILAIANQVLGGGALPAGFTVSSLNDLVDDLNQAFDNCVVDGWAQQHL